MVLENCIMRKGFPASAGSGILAGFTSPFDAAAVGRLAMAGYEIAGQASMPEFAIPALTPDFPAATDGGPDAVDMVLSGAAGLALCNDPFGTMRRKAAFSGLSYIQPTYGTVSRYGLIPTAPSMDRIGVLCGDVPEGLALLTAISGHDPRDGAMYPDAPGQGPDASVSEAASAGQEAREPRLAFPWGLPGVGADVGADSGAEGRAAAGGGFGYLDHADAAMYAIACVEACSSLSRYDGIGFGYSVPNYESLDDLYVRTRSEGMGFWAKLTAVMGSMFLTGDNYVNVYGKATRVRRVIKDSFVGGGYEAAAFPVGARPAGGDAAPAREGAAPEGGGILSALSDASLTSLAGLPSLTVPYAGGGLQIVGMPGSERALLPLLRRSGRLSSI